MRTTKHLIISLFTAFIVTGCGGSSFTTGKDITTIPTPVDPVVAYSPDVQDDQTYVTNHCQDLSTPTSDFITYKMSVANKDAYADFINATYNLPNSGWILYYLDQGRTQYWNYEKYYGTKVVDYWNQQPLEGHIGFTQGRPNYAKVVVKVTGNGALEEGQPNFPTLYLTLDGQIDCNSENLHIISKTPNGWFQLIADKSQGNKHSNSIRATLYFNGKSLGTTFFSQK